MKTSGKDDPRRANIDDLRRRVGKRLSEVMRRLAETDFEDETAFDDFSEALYELDVMNKLHNTLSRIDVSDLEGADE